MPSAEEELETAVWSAMTVCQITCPKPVLFIEAITFAAQRYAAGDSPILTELRRRVLHRDAAEHSSGSSSGGVSRTAPEPPRPPGSAAFPQDVADGGATRSTEASIPGPLTSGNDALSTPVDEGYPQPVRSLPADPEHQPGTITPAQQRAIMAKLGHQERAQRLAALTLTVGRKISTTNELSYAEAQLVLAALAGKTSEHIAGLADKAGKR